MPTNTDRKLRVFLCHSSQDKPIVRELYKRLNAEGWIDPWLDEEKLLPGQEWDMEIEKAVEVADAVIVCLSNNSVTKSGYIQKELRKVLDIADEKPDGEVFVIPVRFDNCELPPRLKRKHCAEYSLKNNAVGYSRILQSLENKVKSLGIRIDKLKLQEEADERAHKEKSDKVLVQIMLENKKLEVAIQIIDMVGRPSNFGEVARRVVEVVVTSLSTEDRPVFGALQRLDIKTKELVLVDVAGVGYEKGREDVRVKLGQGVTGRVAKMGKALLIDDLTDDKWSNIYTDVMAGNMRSQLAVPLMREKKVWGVLNIESPELKAFDENDKLLLQTLADQIMIALRIAEEHEQIVVKEKLERELQIAREIQESFVPHNLPYFEGFEVGACTRLARAVGGDFFDFVSLNHDSIGVLIGDVTDRGIPASIFMAMTRSLIRALASPKLSPREVLLEVNHHIYEMNTANMFVTVIYGVLSRQNRTFTYARAGHEYPLLFDNNGARIDLPHETGQALGIFLNSDLILDEHVVAIPPSGTLLLFTDGVVEARNNQNEEFGVKGIVSTVRDNLKATSQDLCDSIMKAVETYQGGLPQIDDITVVGLHAKE